jgi:hypothetical protein
VYLEWLPTHRRVSNGGDIQFASTHQPEHDYSYDQEKHDSSSTGWMHPGYRWNCIGLLSQYAGLTLANALPMMKVPASLDLQ